MSRINQIFFDGFTFHHGTDVGAGSPKPTFPTTNLTAKSWVQSCKHKVEKCLLHVP
jgi:hypothetical protein